MLAKTYIEYDDIVGCRYRPDTLLDLASPAGGRYRISVNSEGLKSDRRYPFSKPPGVFRILVFGDSFCAGQYLNNRDRFTEQMECLHPGLEVLNFGLEGTGTDQQLLLFERYGTRYEYDLVMVCPFVENIRRNLASYRIGIDPETGSKVLVPKPHFTLIENGLILRGVPVPPHKVPIEEADDQLLNQTDFGGSDINHWMKHRIRTAGNRLLLKLRLKCLIYRFIRHEPFPEYKNPSSPAWLLMSAIIRRFKELAGDRPLIIAPFVYDSYMRYRMATNYIQRFASLEKEEGAHLIDMLPYFSGLSSNAIDQCFLPGDCHYSPFAHGILARAFMTELRRLAILDGCEKAPLPARCP